MALMWLLEDPPQYVSRGQRILSVLDGSGTVDLLPGKPDVEAGQSDWDRIVTGGARRAFAIGDQFQCNKGGSPITWDLVHIGDNADGSNYVVLYVHDLLSSIQFCAQQAAFYATSAVPAGTYHFNPSLVGMSGTWASSDWQKTMQFTTTVDIPKGGQIVLSGDIDWNNYSNPWESGTKLATYSGPTSTTALETITPAEGSEGTDLATLGEINCSQIMVWGSSNWKESDIRQYLNADGAASSWWTAQTHFSRIPGSASKIGFMNDIDADFLDVISKVKLKTDENIGEYFILLQDGSKRGETIS